MKQILSCRVVIEIVSYNERKIIMVNKITLLRMKKICWKFKNEKNLLEVKKRKGV